MHDFQAFQIELLPPSSSNLLANRQGSIIQMMNIKKISSTHPVSFSGSKPSHQIHVNEFSIFYILFIFYIFLVFQRTNNTNCIFILSFFS